MPTYIRPAPLQAAYRAERPGQPRDATPKHGEGDILSIGGFLKAHPAEEGGRRYLYIQASDETVDQQGEVVLARALAESAPHFLRYGNIDLDHITQVGPKAGIPNYHTFEIGRPVEVRVDGARTFVKGEIFQGAGADNANSFWKSVTSTVPPQRWYPSVAGAVLPDGREARIQPNGERVTLIRGVRWTNIGLSKTPVNSGVPPVVAAPLEMLAKSLTAEGFRMPSASSVDAAVLRAVDREHHLTRELAALDLYAFRDRLAGDIRRRRLADCSAASLIEHAERRYHLSKSAAITLVEDFLGGLRRGINRQRAEIETRARVPQRILLPTGGRSR